MVEYSPLYMAQTAQNNLEKIASGIITQNFSAIQTGSYTASISDEVILISGTFLPLNVLLPSVGVPAGKVFTIKEISSTNIKSNLTSGSLLVSGVSSVNFDGVLTGFIAVGNQDRTSVGTSGTVGPTSRKSYLYDGTQFYNIY